MGMVKCRECGKDVSDQAKTCPHCGVAKPAPESKLGLYVKLGLGAVLVIAMARCTSGQEERKSQALAEKQRIEVSTTPQQRAREEAEKAKWEAQNAKREAEFQSVVRRLRALKATTKNPNSFELVDAVLMNDSTLCATYRGTNSFNAVVTESKAIAKDLKIVEWSRFCRGKSGTDMQYARQAL